MAAHFRPLAAHMGPCRQRIGAADHRCDAGIADGSKPAMDEVRPVVAPDHQPVVLAILFYAVVTPMGVIMRALGKDPLRLKREASDPSYWITREPPGPQPDSMSDQF
jgi:hypothetical protein